MEFTKKIVPSKVLCTLNTWLYKLSNHRLLCKNMTFWIYQYLSKKILIFRRLTLFRWSRSRSSDQQACLMTSFHRNSEPSQGRQCELLFLFLCPFLLCSHLGNQLSHEPLEFLTVQSLRSWDDCLFFFSFSIFTYLCPTRIQHLLHSRNSSEALPKYLLM